jgi:predicted transcriptional regulator with HTH domain
MGQDPAQVRRISKDLDPDPTQVIARLTKLDPMGVKSFLKGLNVKAYVGESSCIEALLFK